MRNFTIVFMALFLILFSLSVFAHENIESVETVLNKIMASQGVTSLDGIDCDSVSEHQFEELGDAVMEEMHPGEQHELMDEMMGGEGSESLKAMHVSMGRSYLRCNGFGIGGSGMMGGMMGSGMMGGMAWNNYYGQDSFFSSYTFFLALITIIVVLVVLNVFLVVRLSGRRKK
ncbi:MAG: hypothetical protein ABH821_05995 [archaeon]